MIGSGGRISLIGAVDQTPAGGFAFTVADVLAWSNQQHATSTLQIRVLDGWLFPFDNGHVEVCSSPSTPVNRAGCNGATDVNDTAADPAVSALAARPADQGPGLHRLWLTRLNDTGGGELLTSFELTNP